ncbi:MAG TPA: TadE family protein [bacterium]|nr:TadE family protein [bacterium]
MRDEKGQAMSELILVLPLLTGLILGLMQMAVFLSARCAFEYACGQAARQYAGGFLSDPTTAGLSNALWAGLGTYQRFFDPGSFQITPVPATSEILAPFQKTAGLLPGPLGSFLNQSAGRLLNYGGQWWVLRIRFKGLPLASWLLPQGVWVETQMCVLKYPFGAPP